MSGVFAVTMSGLVLSVGALIVVVELVRARRSARRVSSRAVGLGVGAAVVTIAAAVAGWAQIGRVGVPQIVATGVAGAVAGVVTLLQSVPSSDGGATSALAATRAPSVVEGPSTAGGNIALRGTYVAGHDLTVESGVRREPPEVP